MTGTCATGQPRRLHLALIHLWGSCCFVGQWLFSGELDTASRTLWVFFKSSVHYCGERKAVGLLLPGLLSLLLWWVGCFFGFFFLVCPF